MRRPAPVVAIAALAILLLAIPASASALPFEVDNTGDTPGGACTAVDEPPDCTLRSAIELSNSTPNGPHLIGFTSDFNGEPGDTIALTGPLPITEPVTIEGPSCDGPCVEVSGPSNNFGLQVKDASDVTIARLSITGAPTGIDVDGSRDFRAEANWIGVKLDGTAGPNGTGISLGAGSDGAEIGGGGGEANVIANSINAGLDIDGAGGATIADNIIGRGVGGATQTAGTVGIQVTQAPGTTIEGNVVERAHLIGIYLNSSDVSVTGNEVLGTESDSGIVIQAFGPQSSSGNTIGGDSPAKENVISGSGSNAIEIDDGSDTGNQILRNTGSGNSGLFIDLGRDGLGNQPNGPNGGIQAPAITSATPTEVSGGALPGAVIRVFGKASARNGEIESFLGEAEADGSGNWTFFHQSPLRLGAEIGVTQTGPDGTSELAQATTANPPPPPPPAGGGGGRQPIKLGGGVGLDTRITKGPKKLSSRRTAIFRFRGGPRFECKLDRRPFRPCRSPKRYRRLRPGRHVFRVRSTEAGGRNRERTPAVRRFRVLR